jgi:2,3-bisphosphoglycerate-dependent phosphoglycerate mutase
MARVDLYTKNTMWTVGEDWFLHSFFSTIAYRLEPNGWGSRFRALMKELYTGRLPAEHLQMGRKELATVRAELTERPPQERIFAYEDPERPTPWDVPPGATSLADSFLTATGRKLLDVIEEAISDASEISADVEIRPFAREGTHDVFVTGENR